MYFFGKLKAVHMRWLFQISIAIRDSNQSTWELVAMQTFFSTMHAAWRSSCYAAFCPARQVTHDTNSSLSTILISGFLSSSSLMVSASFDLFASSLQTARQAELHNRKRCIFPLQQSIDCKLWVQASDRMCNAR